MPMSESVSTAYNDQIHLEFESNYAYLQMAAYFNAHNLQGFSNWMRAQAAEEQMHALKFIDFVLDRGGNVRLQPIAAPRGEFSSPLEVFEASLEHERKVTAAIHQLYTHAVAESDYASVPLLQWFISEQVEEESTVGQIVEQLRMVGDNATALLMLDRELGARGVV